MATRLAEDGASASEVQHILGHESLNTSQAYIDATANEQRAAVRGEPHIPCSSGDHQRSVNVFAGEGNLRHSDEKASPSFVSRGLEPTIRGPEHRA